VAIFHHAKIASNLEPTKMSLDIIDRNILALIENHVIEHNGLNLKLLGFVGKISVAAYSFPSSFDYDEARSQLTALKYENLVHLLNATYQKLGIDELSQADFEKSVAQGSEYWYLHIDFNTPIAPELRKFFKSQAHNFIIFLTEAEDDRGFRLMYSRNYFLRYVEEFNRAIYLDLDELDANEDESYKIDISHLESVIYGICKTIGIDIPVNLQSATLDRLILQPPTLETFECFLKLVTRDSFDDLEYKKDAKDLEVLYRERGKYSELSKNPDFDEDSDNDEVVWHIEVRMVLEDYEMAYYSDWKFDPENIEWALSNILGEDFTFEYPEDTHSQDLFPCIQAALKQKNLELMNIDTCGDSYLFFVANIDDIDRILEIGQKIDLNIERV
jgi:hypothetical protein